MDTSRCRPTEPERQRIRRRRDLGAGTRPVLPLAPPLVVVLTDGSTCFTLSLVRSRGEIFPTTSFPDRSPDPAAGLA
jgi:hypothetical protein